MIGLWVASLLGGLCLSSGLWAAGPVPVSLYGVPVPPVPGLLDGANPIVIDKTAAIVLGKALFWDQNVGSDGQACASCHFHAGADSRIKNQINPGQHATQPTGQHFDTLPSGRDGPNHVLSAADFPLHQFTDPNDNTSAVIFSSDNVVGSAGSFGGRFQGVSQFVASRDTCARGADALFNVGGVGVRQVTARNAPSVINAVFNHRNFWDGRANNSFNGSSAWGERDPDAGVWIKINARRVVKQRLHLINSALASQALAPPLNSVEMSCDGRRWPDLGRKLLNRQPLQDQQVHGNDSVLGPLSLSSAGQLKVGLNTTYRKLVSEAFDARFWAYSGIGPFGAPAAGGLPYSQVEANFSMFFALAIQLYESTLVSDQSPFDLSPIDSHMKPTWSNIQEATLELKQAKVASLKNGVELFMNNHCNQCHTGPAFSLAAININALLLTPTPGASFGPPATPIAFGPNAFGPFGVAARIGVTRYGNTVNRDLTAQQLPKLMDMGFVNNGAVNPDADPGLDGRDAFGNPLSYGAQYVDYLLGNTAALLDPGVDSIRACDFISALAYNYAFNKPFYFLPSDGLQVDGSREGVPRTIDCINPVTAYIPTPAGALANLNTAKMAVASHGAFKVPTLRNVELTGPYMHNGGMATLEQVVQFYGRHGNFNSDTLHTLLTSFSTLTNPASNLADMVNFLKALTDERVRYQQAPFDHPQLKLSQGQVGDEFRVEPGNALDSHLAKDAYLILPAIGADGAGQALTGFLAENP